MASPALKLAKDHLDFGLYTNAREEMLAFWQQEVGLPFEETLPAGGGVHQLRHGMNGSVMKINHARDPLEPSPASGYRELFIARAGLDAPRALVDPDGNRVTLVPPGTHDVTGIAVSVCASDARAFERFYVEGLGLECPADGSYRCGDSLLFVEEDPANAAELSTNRMMGPGFRYLTIQVHEVDAVHAAVLARGGHEGRPPVTLGKVARISFVRDPDGNWIELSQRASLTGPLPT